MKFGRSTRSGAGAPHIRGVWKRYVSWCPNRCLLNNNPHTETPGIGWIGLELGLGGGGVVWCLRGFLSGGGGYFSGRYVCDSRKIRLH